MQTYTYEKVKKYEFQNRVRKEDFYHEDCK